MDGTRVSDFSIERILSPGIGLGKPPAPPALDFAPDGYLQGLPGGFSLDSGGLRPPAPLPVPLPVPVPVPVSVSVPVPGCLPYFGDAFYPYGAGLYHPNPGVCVHLGGQDSADVQPLPGYHGYHQVTQPPRHRARMRTVFTDAQSRQLEALFACTDYPAVEARAEVARSTGLSEETVRVWFKNRRARRKRQRSGSKVKSPSPPPAERRPFTCFL